MLAKDIMTTELNQYINAYYGNEFSHRGYEGTEGTENLLSLTEFTEGTEKIN